MEKKLNLDITVCVICNNEPITINTFPHYGKNCLEYLKKHGCLPTEKNTQRGLDAEKDGVQARDP